MILYLKGNIKVESSFENREMAVSCDDVKFSELLTLRKAQADAAKVERMRRDIIASGHPWVKITSTYNATGLECHTVKAGNLPSFGGGRNRINTVLEAMSAAHAAVCGKDGAK